MPTKTPTPPSPTRDWEAAERLAERAEALLADLIDEDAGRTKTTRHAGAGRRTVTAQQALADAASRRPRARTEAAASPADLIRRIEHGAAAAARTLDAEGRRERAADAKRIEDAAARARSAIRRAETRARCEAERARNGRCTCWAHDPHCTAWDGQPDGPLYADPDELHDATDPDPWTQHEEPR